VGKRNSSGGVWEVYKGRFRHRDLYKPMIKRRETGALEGIKKDERGGGGGGGGRGILRRVLPSPFVIKSQESATHSCSFMIKNSNKNRENTIRDAVELLREVEKRLKRSIPNQVVKQCFSLI